MKRPEYHYYIPLYGWILSISEWQSAIDAHSRALQAGKNGRKELEATWEPFDMTFIGMATTLIGLVLLSFATLIVLS